MKCNISRRVFLKGAGVAALAVASSAMLSGCSGDAVEEVVKKDVTVFFIYGGVKQNKTATVKVLKTDTTFNTALITPDKLPEGFKVAKQGEVAISADNTAEVEITVGTATKIVEVRFFVGQQQLPKTGTAEVAADATVVNASEIKMPDDYARMYEITNGQPAIGTDQDGKLYTVAILAAKEMTFSVQYKLDGTLLLVGTYDGLSNITTVSKKDLKEENLKYLEEKGYEPAGDGTVNGDVVTVILQKIMGNVKVIYKYKNRIVDDTKSLELWIKDTKVTGETLKKQAPLDFFTSLRYTIDEGLFDVIWTGNSGVVNATVSSLF